MTDREKEIVMAYAGMCTLTGDELLTFQKYVEDIVGRPVSMDKIKIIVDEMKKKVEDIFTELCSKNDISEPEWIPVKEKWAPEEGGTYLVVVHDKRIFESGYGTVTAYYNKKENQWVPDDEWIKGEVVAWMPMPEPYKPESEEQK